MKLNNKMTAVFAAALASTTLAGCDRVRDNEAAIKTDYGRVAQIINKPDEKGRVWLLAPGSELIKYTTKNQEVTASTDQETSGGKNRQIIRTADGYQVEGTVIARFNLNTDDEAKFVKIYTELTSNTEASGDAPQDGYKDDLQRIVLVATSSAMEKFKGADLSSHAEEISIAITKELQKIVDQRKWPFQVSSTAPNIGLTKAANELFEQNAQLDARNAMATKRQSVAANEANAAKADAAATAGIYKAFTEVGASGSDAVALTCLELMKSGASVKGPCVQNTAIGLPAPK